MQNQAFIHFKNSNVEILFLAFNQKNEKYLSNTPGTLFVVIPQM